MGLLVQYLRPACLVHFRAVVGLLLWQWILPFTLFPNLEEMSGSACQSPYLQDKTRLVRLR
jgi:hypothetical protein